MPQQKAQKMFTLDSTYGPIVTSEQLGLPVKMSEAIASHPVLMYLLVNGLKQSIGDAGALPKPDKLARDVRDGVKAAVTLDGKIVEAGGRDAYQAEQYAKKLDAILSGTVAVGTRGPQKKGLAWFLDEAAEIVLKAEYKKGGKAWPQGKGSAAEVNGKVVEFWTKASPNAKLLALRAEARRTAEANFALQNSVSDSTDDCGI